MGDAGGVGWNVGVGSMGSIGQKNGAGQKNGVALNIYIIYRTL